MRFGKPSEFFAHLVWFPAREIVNRVRLDNLGAEGLNLPLTFVARGWLDGGDLTLQIGLRRDQLCNVYRVRSRDLVHRIDDHDGLRYVPWREHEAKLLLKCIGPNPNVVILCP